LAVFWRDGVALVREVAAVAGAALILGDAAHHHHPLLPAGMLAIAVRGVVAMILLIAARRSQSERPNFLSDRAYLYLNVRLFAGCERLTENAGVTGRSR
jgi:2-polyprenyl-6-methoxyphenol hydroxylase-like FAD-dependent oxidoreductase